MNEKMKSLNLQTKTNDVDEKGIVTVAVNGIGIEDSQHDISMPGSFDETLKSDIERMRWFLNHRQDLLLGVPLEGKEQDGNLVMRGQINLEKQIGRDTLADYKLFAEHGRTLEHSIGVKAIQRDTADKRKVLKWFMGEYSTLTNWGSNPQTFLVNIKSATPDQVRDAVDFIRLAFKERGYSDERLKNYDMELDLLLKSLEGGTIVACPHCGMQFDYDAEPEHTFSQEVIDNAASMLRWITEGIVRQEMQKLTPEIRAGVLDLLDSFKGKSEDLTTKSITELLHYVRCPHCCSRVYRTNNIMQAPIEKSDSGKKPDEDESKKPEDEKKPDDKKPANKKPEGEEKPEDKESEKKKSSDDFWSTLNNSF